MCIRDRDKSDRLSGYTSRSGSRIDRKALKEAETSIGSLFRNLTKDVYKRQELFKGGIIKVDMSNQPNMNRGTKEEDMPYSFSKEQ